MAPQSPFRTEKPVTLAKVKPSVPPANWSSPSLPRNAVVTAILANQVRFMATKGSAIPLCIFSSESIICRRLVGHFLVGLEAEGDRDICSALDDVVVADILES
ncbi:hypothetical protein GQ457_07G010270 [Hibiscus cannabinus]